MNNLKLLREEKNISQIQLAAALGISQQAVAKWETGEAMPRAEKLSILAKILNCTIDDILNDEWRDEWKDETNERVTDF